jgi:hypothetical protein
MITISVSPDCFLALPKIDAENNYESIVFGLPHGNIIKINKEGYLILQFILKFEKVNLNYLLTVFEKNDVDAIHVQDFVDLMIKEGVIIKEDD